MNDHLKKALKDLNLPFPEGKFEIVDKGYTDYLALEFTPLDGGKVRSWMTCVGRPEFELKDALMLIWKCLCHRKTND